MSLTLFAFGLNHHSAPIAVRERVSMAGDLVQPAIASLRARFGERLEEVTILSTCNRTEIYCVAQESVAQEFPEWLATYHHMDLEQLSPYLFQYHQEAVVKHAFRVACGLDSMVLGETQILGQFKTAVREAEKAQSLGTLLHQLFQKTFSTAKDVRTLTQIGAQSVSMAAAAVRMSERVFGELSDCRILFIGAGEMIELCSTHFAAQKPKEMVVANRTKERAQRLADQYPGATTLSLVDLPNVLDRFDIVVTCTASSLPILGLGMIRRAISKRRHLPMVIVDLAVPRDVEPEVKKLDDVYLYSVDDLGQYVKMGEQARQATVSKAEEMVSQSVERFMNWLERRSIVPLIQSMNESAQKIQQAELEKALKKLQLGQSPEEVLTSLANGLSRKYLHRPMHALNHLTGQERETVIEALSHLFPLD